MKKLFWISTVIFFCSVIFLVTGSPLLVKPILKTPEIPLGNLTTTLGFIALSLALWSKIKVSKKLTEKGRLVLDILAKFGIALTLIWWPLGRYLCGNWQNSFQNIPEKSALFWTLTYIIIGFLILLWLCYLISILFQKKKIN